jgi:hypothetical protein
MNPPPAAVATVVSAWLRRRGRRPFSIVHLRAALLEGGTFVPAPGAILAELSASQVITPLGEGRYRCVVLF